MFLAQAFLGYVPIAAAHEASDPVIPTVPVTTPSALEHELKRVQGAQKNLSAQQEKQPQQQKIEVRLSCKFTTESGDCYFTDESGNPVEGEILPVEIRPAGGELLIVIPKNQQSIPLSRGMISADALPLTFIVLPSDPTRAINRVSGDSIFPVTSARGPAPKVVREQSTPDGTSVLLPVENISPPVVYPNAHEGAGSADIKIDNNIITFYGAPGQSIESLQRLLLTLETMPTYGNLSPIGTFSLRDIASFSRHSAGKLWQYQVNVNLKKLEEEHGERIACFSFSDIPGGTQPLTGAPSVGGWLRQAISRSNTAIEYCLDNSATRQT